MDTTTAPEPAPEPPAARVPRAARVAIPGGSAHLAGEVRVVPAERPDEEILLQALEVDGRPALLRLGYRRAGRPIRGPVTATPAEVHALLALAHGEPALAALLERPATRRGRASR